MTVKSKCISIVFGIVFAIIAILLSASSVIAADAGRLNPDLSLNALMLYTNSSRGNYIDSKERNGPSLRETEVQFTSAVDPYSKLTAVLSIHQDAPATGKREGDWKIEPEEVYADSTTLPSVTLRVGKFKAALGKHNLLHTHAFAFVDTPLVNAALLGEEGLKDVGLGASSLIPFPWFSEMTVQVFSGRTGKADASGTSYDYFNNNSSNASVYVAHFKNLWDLTEALTCEFGLSAATGANEYNNASGVSTSGKTEFYGGDLSFKWRPMRGGKMHSVAWVTEYLSRHIARPQSANRGDGFASWVRYQFAERWWAQLRGEEVNVKDDDSSPLAIARYQRKNTVLIGFVPSEFSDIRLQYSRMEDGQKDPENKIYLQFGFAIGAHPAHAY